MKNNERKLPAYPLFVKDPNFSLWTTAEELNSVNVTSWYGAEKKIYGFIKTRGETYCFLGNAADFKNSGVKKAEQLYTGVTAFTTDYEFKAGNARLKVSFVSPLPPADLQLLSMPVCYMNYEVTGDDNAEISLFVNRRIAYNDISENSDKRVKGGVMPLKSFEAAFIGLKRQLPLSNAHDVIGADWGWWYLSGESAYILDESDLSAYLSADFIDFSNRGDEKYIGSMNRSKSGIIMLGFDEGVSIDYFGEYLKGLYLSDNNITDALRFVYKESADIDRKLSFFDEDLRKKAKECEADYLNVLYASLRQSIAAHKLVKDRNGEVLFLSKECGSNGCIATVDVSYPSVPLYLLYNPELVKGMMRPILKFARMPIWKYDFAPHDCGIYPFCTGQVYALKGNGGKYRGNYAGNSYVETSYPVYLLPPEFDAYDFDRQMPVEECANMLIMFAALDKFGGEKSFFLKNADLCKKWVEYLVKDGLKPDTQLCTDDFAGHLRNNLNLAIKAVVGIACYAELNGNEKYMRIAKDYADKISAFMLEFDHSPLTWDSGEETFSLKYNFVFDKILGFGLFKQSLLEREVDYCLTKIKKFGIPLDSRKEYTKSDWLMWLSGLTDDKDKRNKIIAAVDRFLKESPDRVPFSDWFDTVSGEAINTGYYKFAARSVQGGCFVDLIKIKS